MYKSKIFSGFDADNQFNEWCANHPGAVIQSFHFVGKRDPGWFAICILYTEYTEEGAE